MALSVVNLYRDILPKTNCKDCGFPTCMAFASMVVSEKHPIKNCPYLTPAIIKVCEKELAEQYAAGKWLRRDMKEDALKWAKEKSASMKIEDLPGRIGGKLIEKDGTPALELPYFNEHIIITPDRIMHKDGSAMTRYEQVFIYIHMAQGGNALPSGKWRNFVEFPNTVSKMKSMIEQVETPLIEKFQDHTEALTQAALKIGGINKHDEYPTSDVAMLFAPLPRVPVMLMFWDGEEEDGFGAEAKLSFDDTITEHLDIESIMFLSERLRELLCDLSE
ncbi:MAG: DUF3786 domain-containing protein [Desulfobacteraceae bacterium]|nr:DUF3786 domain-containing protein [Desulfobacteraceae bacterium]MBC2754308.1 DUF3786 domain-containing protein [Desulfobacteraceae bacterium]